jgi:hypothetical protein
MKSKRRSSGSTNAPTIADIVEEEEVINRSNSYFTQTRGE